MACVHSIHFGCSTSVVAHKSGLDPHALSAAFAPAVLCLAVPRKLICLQEHGQNRGRCYEGGQQQK